MKIYWSQPFPTDDPQPDILNFVNPVEETLERNKFMKELVEFIKKNEEVLSPESDPSIRLTRNTESSEEVLDRCFSIVEDFISKLWLGMKERYALTDLSAGPTSYSEAPAESVFSVWERVSAGRSSLSIENTIALTRVAMEGPVALLKTALNYQRLLLKSGQVILVKGAQQQAGSPK